jgi:hypothetical protein
MKLALVTALAVLVGTGSAAHAITVTKKRDMPGEASAVWALVGDFCAIKELASFGRQLCPQPTR